MTKADIKRVEKIIEKSNKEYQKTKKKICTMCEVGVVGNQCDYDSRCDDCCYSSHISCSDENWDKVECKYCDEYVDTCDNKTLCDECCKENHYEKWHPYIEETWEEAEAEDYNNLVDYYDEREGE